MIPFDLKTVSHAEIIALCEELDRHLLDPTSSQYEFSSLVRVMDQLAAEMRRRLLAREVGMAREATSWN